MFSNQLNPPYYHIDQIRKFIEKGKLKDAIEILIDLAKTLDGDLRNQVSIISMQYYTIEIESDLGLINREIKATERIKVAHCILNLLTKLEKIEYTRKDIGQNDLFSNSKFSDF